MQVLAHRDQVDWLEVFTSLGWIVMVMSGFI